MKKILICLLCPYLATAQINETIPELSFRYYLEEVGKSNLTYLAGKYNVSIADAAIEESKILPDPELVFEGEEESFSLELEYTLETGNKRGNRVRLAKSEASAERLVLEHFYRELQAEAAEAFLEAWLQQELLNVKKSSYEYMYRLSQSDSIRYQLGEITENDARQSRLEAATLLNEVYKQEGELKTALTVLNYYMGKEKFVTSLSFDSRNACNGEYELQSLIEIAIQNRRDLEVAAKETEIMINQLRLIKAERKPDIGVLIGYEKDWGGFYPDRHTLKGGISIPLKFSNFNKGAVKAASFSVEKSKLEYQDRLLQVRTEITSAWHTYQAVKKQTGHFEINLLEDARKLLDGIVYKYQRGETDILEVLIAQRTYNEISEEYLEVTKDCASAWIELQKMSGIWDMSF